MSPDVAGEARRRVSARARRVMPIAALAIAVIAAACSLPDRGDVEPVNIRTNVLSCDELSARGQLINEFKTDVTGRVMVEWVDFFGDVYHMQTEGPYRIGPGETVEWLVEVRGSIAAPGHCTVELDFFE